MDAPCAPPASARVSANARLVTDPTGQRGPFCLDAQTKFLSELDEKIRPLNDDEEILWTAVRAAGEFLEVSRCMISEVDHQSDTSIIHRDYCRRVPTVAGTRQLSSFGTVESLALLHAGHVLAVEDTAADARTAAFYKTAYRPLQIRSFVSVPCMSGGEWVATLSACSAAPRAWKDDEIALLRTVAAHVWLPVENVRLIARLRQELREREQAETALRASEERFRRLSDANTIGVMSGDAERIQDANEIFLAMLGHTRGEMREGRVRWRDITPPEWADLDEEKFKELLSRGAVLPYEKEYLTRDGRRVPVMLGIAAVTHEPLSWIAFALDLTESKKAQRELQLAKETAEAASMAKDHFLAMLSHELRTPLTPALITLSALAREKTLPTELRDDLRMIQRSVEFEARLIDDLLDLTRITNGKLLLDRAALDVHETLREAIAMLRVDALGKRLTFALDLAAEKFRMNGDRARLEQVFCNLIKNAIKFSPVRGCLRISSRNRAADGALILKFTDEGIGIEPRLLSTIFNAFEQGSSSITQRFGGLGLGLAISKALIEMHGGAISAASQGLGCGSEFTIELPVNASAEISDLPPLIEPAAASRALKILLVEDNEPTSYILSRLLQKRGHVVRSVATVLEARKAAADEEFDLVVSDLGLPDGTGFDLMRELKTRYALRGIALSGYGMEQDIQKSREHGFDLHLTKPIDVQKLEGAIRRVCENPSPNV
jgi:PAS domain S-box-containing protein